jgi:hypothetical protein
MPSKAKIFLSCGQNKSTEEPNFAASLAAAIRSLGFDCYIAIVDQSLSGLRENIFRQLDSSEYFVFVDFLREKLINKNGEVESCRGSLFSHQELAIASYLEMPCLVFQEHGIKQRDGMLSSFHVNPVEFTDRSTLVEVVRKAVAARIESGEWSTTWKNGLHICLPTKKFGDAARGVGGPMYRYYHISLHNLHRSMLALNCYAILQSVEVVATGVRPSADSIEIKWAGSNLPNVFVSPKSSRRFDALRIAHGNPTKVEFVIPWCDSTEFWPHVEGVGRYRITYSVSSSNFPVADRVFMLDLTGDINTTTLAEY